MDTFYQQPPVIRTLTAAVVVTSCAAYANRSFFGQVYFVQDYAMWSIPPQVWRFFTAFLISGSKIYIIMDPYFLFTYGKALETGSPRFRRKGDFAWYVFFIMVVIALILGVVFDMPLFNEALMLAFVHTMAQDNPRMKTHFVIIEIEARFLPPALLFLNFVTRGPSSAINSAAGIAASHLYDFLTRIWPAFGGGRNWIAPPLAWTRWFHGDRAAVQHKQYGEAHYRSARDEGASSTGRAPPAGNVDASWRTRGAGRRLGE